MAVHELKRRASEIQRRIVPSSVVARKFSGQESSSINTLIRRVGNQGIQRLMGEIRGYSNDSARSPSPVIQAKLAVSQPADAYEHEADRVADAVMRMPEPGAQETPDVSSGASLSKVHRMCNGCEEEQQKKTDGVVQRKAQAADTPTPIPTVAANVQRLHGGGSALPQATRAFFEPRFGADFGGVRIHTDERANATAKSIGARAFTLGQDIAFAGGQYSPSSGEGQRLLAHELTHVVQQRASSTSSSAPNSVQSSASTVSRSVAKDSTVKICHRVLTSGNFKVSQGGVRVVIALNPLDLNVPDCRDHAFSVTLTRSREWWPDDEIATCDGRTGGTRSFSFGGLVSGTYYLTIYRVFDHPYCCIDGDILIFDEPIPGDSSSCRRDKDLSAMDIVHGALDMAGFIPVLGAIPDGINAAIYVAEGDWANAGLSAVAMVPAWGDGVKLGVMAEKSVIKISNKAALKLGEEGIATGLKEVKAASKAEKDALEAAARTEREAATRAEKEAVDAAGQETGKSGKKDKGKKQEREDEPRQGGGKWTCNGHSAVLQIPKQLPEHKCPLDGTYVNGPSVSGPTEAAACRAAKHAFNAMMPRGCRPKHLKCKCSKRR